MKKFILGFLDFLQEQDGGKSSRRLIFIYGSVIAIPLSYFYAYKHPELFEQIHDSNLWFLFVISGLATTSSVVNKIADNFKSNKAK